MDKKQFLEDWKYVRGNTIKFIHSVPDNKLSFSPHKNWGTIGKQLRHLADVQDCYLKSIKAGKVSFDNKRKNYEIEKSKKRLLDDMNQRDVELSNVLSKMSGKQLQKKLLWAEVGNSSIIIALTYMKEHEIYHQGILQLYADLAGFKTLRFF